MPKKIKFYKYPDEPRLDQMENNVLRSPLQVLADLEAYKILHKQIHGESEIEKATRGKKIVFRKVTWM